MRNETAIIRYCICFVLLWTCCVTPVLLSQEPSPKPLIDPEPVEPKLEPEVVAMLQNPRSLRMRAIGMPVTCFKWLSKWCIVQSLGT